MGRKRRNVIELSPPIVRPAATLQGMDEHRTLRQRGEDLSSMLGIPDIKIHRPPAVCDESEGLSLREQKMSSARAMPPADPAEAERWRKLIDDAQRGGPPARSR